MRAASISTRAVVAGPLGSRRLLALAGDERLVEQIRRGSEPAFAVAFERHAPAILGFCRHMLGSREEAEDAVQHTFAAAYRDLQRDGERRIVLKPWLFAIARNRCLSVLRARREPPGGMDELEAGSGAVPTAGLAEQVEQRAELRLLLADLRELPDEQRAALLLAEVGDLSHGEVAGVLGCEVARVKALVFRARSALIARREARETPCDEIREQLANLRGGSLRRSELRLHLRDCPGCRVYRERVREQRRMLAAALPVAPTLGLKSSVLAAVGIGGGSAGGGAAAVGLTGIAGATLTKVAMVTALAGGGVVAGTAVVESERDGGGAPTPAVAAPARGDDRAPGAAATPGAERSAGAGAEAPGRDRPAARIGGPRNPSDRRGTGPTRGGAAPGVGRAKQGRARGHERGALEKRGNPGREQARGGGPVAPPPPSPPVRRGPPEASPKAAPAPAAEPKPKAQAPTKPEAPVVVAAPAPEPEPAPMPAPEAGTGGDGRAKK